MKLHDRPLAAELPPQYRCTSNDGRCRAVFFCSAVPGIDEESARKVIRAVCAAGYDIVSGGTVKGTMDIVCRTAKECGARCIGVIPRFMKGLENPLCDELIWTDTMAERKELMHSGVALAIALPGGIGTLDEFADTFCLVKLGILETRMIAWNEDGFYEPLKALLNHYVQKGTMPAESLGKVFFPESLEELERIIK